jgi:CRISPR-associated protein Cas1
LPSFVKGFGGFHTVRADLFQGMAPPKLALTHARNAVWQEAGMPFERPITADPRAAEPAMLERAAGAGAHEPAALWPTAFGPTGLEAAWHKVARRGGAAGIDGVTTGRFASEWPSRLAALARDLETGRYRPLPPRLVEIPKPGGGHRQLAIPCVADRVVQSAAATALSQHFDPHMSPWSFGYRPRRSVAMAAEAIQRLRRTGYRHVVEGDIARFFDSVEHARLLEVLAPQLQDDRLIDLVRASLAALAPGGAGLPQGAPISPVLANLFLDRFDRAMAVAGTRMVRFADDFVLLSRTAAAADEARSRAGVLLGGLGLALNHEKTRHVSFHAGFTFLGRRFEGPHVVDPARAVPLLPPAPTSGADGLAPEAADEPRLAATARPVMRVLYLGSAGRRLAVRGPAFAAFDGEREVALIPASEVDRIEVRRGNGVSTSALHLGLANGIPIAFVDGHGQTIGTCEAVRAERAALHLAQARCVLDEGCRLDLAARLVAGKVRNQRALLHRLNRKRGDPTIGQAIRRLGRVLRRIEAAPAIATLLGLEGWAGAIYWRGWSRTVSPDWPFVGRTRRPPRDPINVVLSYLSGLLHRDLAALAQRHGLHPGFGALHGTRDRHQGCVSDLIEEFRAPLLEGLAVYLVNNRILVPAMFIPRDDDTWSIAAAGHQRMIRGYEHWLDRRVRSPRSGRSILWRRLLEEQVVAYAQHVCGKAPYQAYAMDY